MKRIICFLAALIALTSILTGCQPDTITVATAKGTKLDVAPSALSDMECMGTINSEREFLFKGEKAQKLSERMQALITNPIEDYETSDNVIQMSFHAKCSDENVWAGVYIVQDNGVILYTTSPSDSYLHRYSCDKGVYDEILNIVRSEVSE